MVSHASYKNVLVAVPAYNCEEQIIRVIQELSQVAELQTEGTDFLIIDNRSQDGTVAKAVNEIKKAQVPHKFKVVRNLENRGLGGSQKLAFTWAKENNYKLLVVLHGDHQATPKDIPRMLEVIEKRRELSAVLGSRFMSQSVRIGYSKLRTFGNVVLNWFYTLICLKVVRDLGSGLNIFRVSDFELNDLYRFSNAFTFNMDLLLLIVDKKKSVKFFPIKWTELDQVSNAKTFQVGLKALTTVLQWRFYSQNQKQVQTDFGYETIY